MSSYFLIHFMQSGLFFFLLFLAESFFFLFQFIWRVFLISSSLSLSSREGHLLYFFFLFHVYFFSLPDKLFFFTHYMQRGFFLFFFFLFFLFFLFYFKQRVFYSLSSHVDSAAFFSPISFISCWAFFSHFLMNFSSFSFTTCRAVFIFFLYFKQSLLFSLNPYGAFVFGVKQAEGF